MLITFGIGPTQHMNYPLMDTNIAKNPFSTPVNGFHENEWFFVHKLTMLKIWLRNKTSLSHSPLKIRHKQVPQQKNFWIFPKQPQANPPSNSRDKILAIDFFLKHQAKWSHHKQYWPQSEQNPRFRPFLGYPKQKMIPRMAYEIYCTYCNDLLT